MCTWLKASPQEKSQLFRELQSDDSRTQRVWGSDLAEGVNLLISCILFLNEDTFR